ncbi:FAD:protein FMN transferase [Microbacterium betulae]|uniref:FAD:protein FMN transferase n=1 Tax=Microbacterium betulae TaxID=2981139 RepID=A0AA97FLN7_9MICO|nr:FAD:protein FMN transferase [Microbacterium sp. AB]WOF24339.1 FAD:protein FMN transferase [Microbacterium sp. AB]
MPRQASPWRFDAIGTAWEIETDEPLDERVREDVARVIDDFDRQWSRFRDDSVVSGLAASGGRVRTPPDAAAMLGAYAELSEATEGAVNPLVGDALARRGYDSRYSMRDLGAQPAPERWAELLTWDDDALSLSEPATIDVGALGKGRLVDLVADVVRAEAGGRFVVDASGDMRVHGAPVRVALEHPYDSRRAIGTIDVVDGALCASAINRRAWGDGLHHVLDARTGIPVRAYAATWATAPTAMAADAVATALFFDGGPELAHAWGADWVRMTTDGRVEWSPGSKAGLFT